MKTLNELLISRPPWNVSVHCPYVVMDGLYAGNDEIVKAESTIVHDAPKFYKRYFKESEASR